MSVLINQNGPIDDEWVLLEDDAAVPAGKKVIISIQRWPEEREHLQATAAAVGVLLEPVTDVAHLRPDLDSLDIIAIPFSVFSDGRGFSQAHLLRERFGYTKNIRAVGNVLRDQLSFMARCGINEFVLENDDEAQIALKAFSEISVGYQADMLLQTG